MKTLSPERIKAMQDARTNAPTLAPDEKAKANPRSKKYAIAHFCYQCFGGDPRNDPGGTPDPAWKQAIRECSAKSCALYPHRPYH